MLNLHAVRHAAVEVEKNVTVPISTDKGLCGGINSTVSKYARGTLKAFEQGTPFLLPAQRCTGARLCCPCMVHSVVLLLIARCGMCASSGVLPDWQRRGPGERAGGDW